MSKTKTVVIAGQEVEVTVCRPSRRKAAGGIQQKPKGRRVSSGRGALWVARDRGLKTGEVAR